MQSHRPTDSTTAMLGSLQKKPKKLDKLQKTALVSQAVWNITLASAESAYSIATYVTDLFHFDVLTYGMSAEGIAIGTIGGFMLGGSETYSHWAQGSHFAHGESHGHSHGGPAIYEDEEDNLDVPEVKLSWTQSISAGLHYLSESISGTAFPIMAYKTLLSMNDGDEPSPYVYAAISAFSLFCNLQTLLNTRSAFKRENERVMSMN